MQGFFASCTLAALLLASCLAAPTHDHLVEDMSCHELSHHNARFGFDLYKNLRAKAGAGENIFFSPLGISTALSLLSTGAHGETHRQLFSTLGYSAQTQDEINQAYKRLFHMFGHNQEHFRLDVSNAVAIDDGFSPSDSFMGNAKEFYSAEVLKVDFSKPQEAADEINSYIANKTHNIIKEHVKDLSEDVVMMLINAVYFKGEWVSAFNKSYTKKADFQVNETTKVEVDMMTSELYQYDVYFDQENGTTVVMLPYEGNTSMMIILPGEGKMEDVEGYINKDYIKRYHDSVSKRLVAVSMPKFSISAKAVLDSTLKEMGIIDAFENTADFSGISDDIKLKLSKVSHEAVLNVDETGTEAAAATTAEATPVNTITMITMNRPFLALIVEDPTCSILFMGKINNPTAK